MLNLREVCTKQNPWEQGSAGFWQHPDARETKHDSDSTLEYYCPNCNQTWREEMPD